MMLKSRVRGDEGAALVTALIIISVVAVLAGAVLQFGFTSAANTTATAASGKTLYSADGNADGAIRALADNPYLGLDPYNSSCFSTSQPLNATAATVSCRARAGSGSIIGSATLNSQPAAAVTALGTTGTEGVTQSAGTTALVQGDIKSANVVNQGAGATLTTRGSVTGAAAVCTASGVATPAIYCPAPAPTDPAADPTYGASWAMPSTFPPFVTTPTPACTTNTMTISPGTYTSVARIQAVLSCPNTIIHFLPGVYNFDFTDTSASHELTFNGNVTGSVVVAGTRTVPPAVGGWNVNATPGTVPFPTAANPAISACDQTQQGVQFIFGGDSRLNVTSGKFQICSLLPLASTAAQHVAIAGYPTTTQLGTTTSLPTTAVNATNPAAGNRTWSNLANAYGAGVADAQVPNSGDQSEFLDVGGFPTTNLPPTGNVSVTVTFTARPSGTGQLRGLLVYGPAASTTSMTDRLLAQCPGDPACSSAALTTYTITETVPASELSTLRLRLYLNNNSNSPVRADFDAATFTIPTFISGTSGVVAQTGYPGAGTAALIKVAGAYPSTVFVVHGTIYAPNAPLDLAMTGVPHTVVDRGVVVRDLTLATTWISSASTWPVISIPLLDRAPRQVVVSVAVNGLTELIAEATFTNTAATGGTLNGTYAHVTQWSHQR